MYRCILYVFSTNTLLKKFQNFSYIFFIKTINQGPKHSIGSDLGKLKNMVVVSLLSNRMQRIDFKVNLFK